MNSINKKMNVLIFPAGSGVSKEIFDSLKFIRWITIFGMESDEDNFASYQFDNMIYDAPFIKEEEKTIEFLKKVIEKYNIDCIFPGMDNIIFFLKRYERELNVTIISSEINTCEICFSKKKTYDLFRPLLKTPKLYNTDDEYIFPLFVKPECGYGSRNSFLVHHPNELTFYQQKINDLIVCEYLPGEEYTVDCFSSMTNGLLFCEARTRNKTINGMSVLTKTIHLPEVKTMAHIIQTTLHMQGAWFFQVKRDINGVITLLEIAPRIPGAMCLHRVCGVNFPLLSIYEHFGVAIDSLLTNNFDISCYKYFENNYKIMNFDYDTVYIDLDDTIILKNKVNLTIIRFLYQCKNKGKKIVLITRNADPFLCLKTFCISECLFDEIHTCQKSESKTKYIQQGISCIFIDDSFKERETVYKKGIPVFSCDMVELLL